MSTTGGKEETNIQYSKNTVGCRVGGEVFIHPELYKYPKLYHAVVAHEKKHSNSLDLNDVRMDFLNDDLKGVKKDFYLFILKHPRSLLGWLPITKIGKHWALDVQMTVAWLIVIAFSCYIGANL